VRLSDSEARIQVAGHWSESNTAGEGAVSESAAAAAKALYSITNGEGAVTVTVRIQV
jgi:hypothetical protein